MSESPTKKRKWEKSKGEMTGDDCLEKDGEEETEQRPADFELHLETPLPLEWQRCLDLQSGKIHFYNTRTHKRTCRDPRESPEAEDFNHPMRLELKLNLPCDSPTAHAAPPGKRGERKRHETNTDNSSKTSSGLSRSPSWVSLEADQEEMVAAVCMRCHMLVMLCKSSPSCPNCKFMHPPSQNLSSLFKPNHCMQEKINPHGNGIHVSDENNPSSVSALMLSGERHGQGNPTMKDEHLVTFGIAK
ncbi:hypothetical protein ACLOJK_016256 [Asimina triloba]